MGLAPPISKVITFSWQKTKEILFPFELKRWIKILFIVWLAGHTAGVGGGNNVFKQTWPFPKRSQTVAQKPSAIRNPVLPEKANSLITTSTVSQVSHPSFEQPTKKMKQPPVKGVVLLLIPVVLGLMLFFLWLNARFNFIFIDLVVCRDVSIKAAFQKYKSQSNSYFKWLLLFFLISFGFTALLISGAAFIRPLWGLFVFLILVFVPVTIGLGILIDDFVLPAMYRDNIQIGEAFKRVLALKPHASSIVLYLLVKMGLGIASSLIVLVTGLILGLGIIMVGFVFVVLGSFLVTFLSVLKPVLMVVGFFFLVVGVLCVILLLGLVTLPIPIFFRVFALAYLGQLAQNYNLLGFSGFSPSSEVPHV